MTPAKPEHIEPVLHVVFFRSESGGEPVRDWLLGLGREDRKAVGCDIKTAQYGWPLGMPLIRKLEPGLWEVRSRIGDGIARVVFTVEGGVMATVAPLCASGATPNTATAEAALISAAVQIATLLTTWQH